MILNPSDCDSKDNIDIPYYKFHQVQKKLAEHLHFHPPSESKHLDLQETVNRILAHEKSILMCDESGQLGDNLLRYGLHNNEENRRRFRNVLFSTNNPIAPYISLVVLAHEALHQKTNDDRLFREVLKSQGVLIGIKVDKDTVPLYCNTHNELVCQGLDYLDKRCMEYKKSGCDATKFTAVFRVGSETPSERAIRYNAYTLARFAAISQAHNLVPVICCELLMDGDNNLDRAQKAMENILAAVVKALSDHQVLLEATILAPSMVMPGKNSPVRSEHMHIAKASVLAIRHSVPPVVAGIAFLTTGQELEEGCVNLDAIHKVEACKPWPITSVLGDSLQDCVICVWAGTDSKTEKAQKKFISWCMINSLAAQGVYYNFSEESVVGQGSSSIVLK